MEVMVPFFWYKDNSGVMFMQGVGYKIEQTGKYQYSILLARENRDLLQGLSRMFSICKMTDTFKMFSFVADSLKSLSEFLREKKLDYAAAICLIDGLGRQMMDMKKKGKGFIQFRMEDVYIADGYRFFYLGANDVCGLAGEELVCLTPFVKMSPESMKVESLPCRVHWKCGFYNLAALVYRGLYGKEYKEDSDSMKSIVDTKLYWFLKRNLDKDIERRSLVVL